MPCEIVEIVSQGPAGPSGPTGPQGADGIPGGASVKEFGAIGDGTSHPLSEFYDTIEEAQAAFPDVTGLELTDEIDWAAIQQAINAHTGSGGSLVYTYASLWFPKGQYLHNKTITLRSHIKMRGEISSAQFGTRIIRTQDVVGWSAVGISVNVSGSNTLLKRWDVQDIEFDGGWAFSNTGNVNPLIDMRACYEFYWDNFHLTNCIAQGIKAQELWDSRFTNARVTWCGSFDGTKAAFDMLSGAASPGYETCNNIVISGFRFESCPGVGVNIQGNNGVDIWLINNKYEFANYQLDYLVKIQEGSACVFMENNWVYGGPATYNNYKFDVTTTAKALALGSTTFTISTGLVYNSPNFNTPMIRTNQSFIMRDKINIDNYQTGRVTNYDPVTGIITIRVDYVYGVSGATTTSWELAPFYPGLVYVGTGISGGQACRLIKGHLQGGWEVIDNAPVNGVYVGSHVHLDGTNEVDLTMDIVSGATRVPDSQFRAARSLTSVTIGTGQKTFTLQNPTGLTYTVGQYVWVSGRASLFRTYGMAGSVVSWNAGTGVLVINVNRTAVTGTLSDWNISKYPATGFLKTGTNTNSTLRTRFNDFDGSLNTQRAETIISDTSAAPGSSLVRNDVGIRQADFNMIPILDQNTKYEIIDTNKIYLGNNLLARAMTPTTIANGIDSLFPSNTVMELDAGVFYSADSTGTYFRNLAPSPADGSAKSVYDFFLGTAAAINTTEDPAFTGVYDRRDAHYMLKVGTMFTLPTIPAYLRDLHKTASGSFTWIFALKTQSTSATQTLFQTGNTGTAGNPGVRFYKETDGKWYFFMRGDTAPTVAISTASVAAANGDIVVVVSMNRSTNTLDVYWGSGTAESKSATFNASVSDALGPIRLMNNFVNPALVRTFAMLNKAVTNIEVASIIANLSARHGINYPT